MRPLKFQAWHKAKRKMYHVATIMPDARMVMLQSGDTLFSASFEEIELRQFTGLLDKAGKEVYEGDIIEVDELSATRHAQVIWGVYYAPGFWNTSETWLLRFSEDAKGPLYPYCQRVPGEDISIIGNIYDNPELIPQEARDR